MVLLRVSLNNIYGFKDFEVNFSYPRKIINSIIEEEHLEGRSNFRYKNALILMGAIVRREATFMHGISTRGTPELKSTRDASISCIKLNSMP